MLNRLRIDLNNLSLVFLDYLKKVSIRHTHTVSSLLTTLKSGVPEIRHGFLSGLSPHSPTFRIDLITSPQDLNPLSSFLLIRDLNGSKAWKWTRGIPTAQKLTSENWRTPWIDGINHSPFDLLMPFVNWPFEYQKSGRVCGRPAHLFVFTPSNKGNPYSSSLDVGPACSG